MSKKSSSNLGLLVIFMKLGGNVLPILTKLAKVAPKLLKGAVSVKGAGAIASLGAYTLLFSWQMAVSLVAFILIHEFGHLWAMKKCGIKTRGIYLIPFFGGAAVAAEGFKSSRNESFIAIMGPLFGLFFIVPSILLYFVTGNVMFAAIASIMALVNLFNLFPINPLDGGRIVKSLLYSFSASAGFFFMMISFVAAGVVAAYANLGLLWLIALIGLIEIVTDYGLGQAMKCFMRSILRALIFFLLYFQLKTLTGLGWLLIPWAFFLLLGLAMLIGDIYFIKLKMEEKDENEQMSIWKIIANYPLIVLGDVIRGLIELFSIKPHKFKRPENAAPMSRRQVWLHSMIYLLTVLVMIWIIAYTGKLPGCEHAIEILR